MDFAEEKKVSIPEITCLGGKPTPVTLIIDVGKGFVRAMREINEEEFIGFRYSITGGMGYEFYMNKKRICIASCVIPSSTVDIFGVEDHWRCEIDMQDTLFPGKTRYVKDVETGEEVFKLIYRPCFDRKKQMDWLLCCNEIEEPLSVITDNDGYVFCQGVDRLAIMRRAEESDWRPDDRYFEYEPYYRVLWQKQLSVKTLMAMVSYPMLSI